MHRRVLLKLSGEALGSESSPLDAQQVSSFAADIAFAAQSGVEVAIVVGGGNFIRGAQFQKIMKRVTADHLGMLATIMNGLALKDNLLSLGQKTHLYSAVPVPGLAEVPNIISCQNLLAQKEVVIFAGGTGNPFVTTDTASSLRAIEIEADVLLKATKVDGVYDRDPREFPDAKRYENLSFQEAISRNLAVMDFAAFVQCREFNLPIRVFNLFKPGALRAVLLGQSEGTLVN